jgi:hypothetical protein
MLRDRSILKYSKISCFSDKEQELWTFSSYLSEHLPFKSWAFSSLEFF